MLGNFFSIFLLRCLWETCCQKSNPNCSPGLERYCLSQFPALASRISKVYPTPLERPLHNQKGNSIGRYLFHGYECECHLSPTHIPCLNFKSSNSFPVSAICVHAATTLLYDFLLLGDWNWLYDRIFWK